MKTAGQIGEFHGFTLSANFDSFNQTYQLTIKRQCSYQIEVGKDPLGNLQRISNALSGIEKKLTESEVKLETVQQQLATARAENASRNALAKYFESQGMTQEEIASAIADFKAKKSSQHPEVSKAEQERDEALAKVAEMENLNYLRDRGVRAGDLDYVLFKASRRVDDKTDFKKAADAFLKENPRFTGKGYRVVSTSAPDGGSGRSQTVNDSINAAIRSAFGR